MVHAEDDATRDLKHWGGPGLFDNRMVPCVCEKFGGKFLRLTTGRIKTRTKLPSLRFRASWGQRCVKHSFRKIELLKSYRPNTTFYQSLQKSLNRSADIAV
jgi:hypothetical protein